ncbi:MAG TPA: hypothetical protein VE684_04855 [Crenalkalicoccus sp.]|nr:hypothetical protein [Crenalkalicoccus sp.]
MQFRIRGAVAQIVKPVAGEGGKERPQPVGTVTLASGELNPRAQAALSEAERAEVARWVARHREVEARRREVQFQTLPTLLAEVADWVQEAEAGQLAPYQEDVQQALRQLRVALTRKLGSGAGAEE